MRRLLDAFPVDAALAFVGCGLCRDGAGDGRNQSSGCTQGEAMPRLGQPDRIWRRMRGVLHDRHLSASLGTFLVSTTSFTERTQRERKSLKYSRVGACQRG
jgi:hypothetical protein